LILIRFVDIMLGYILLLQERWWFYRGGFFGAVTSAFSLLMFDVGQNNFLQGRVITKNADYDGRCCLEIVVTCTCQELVNM